MNENTIQMPKTPRMETIKRTAELANVPEYFVRTLARSGKIVCVKAGRKFLVNYDKFVEMLNTNIPVDDKPAEVDSSCRIAPIPREL